MTSNARHGSPPRLMAHQPTRFAAAQESRPSPSPGIRMTTRMRSTRPRSPHSRPAATRATAISSSASGNSPSRAGPKEYRHEPISRDTAAEARGRDEAEIERNLANAKSQGEVVRGDTVVRVLWTGHNGGL